MASVLHSLVQLLVIQDCSGRQSMFEQLAVKTAWHTSCICRGTHSTCRHFFNLQDLDLAILLLGSSNHDTMNAWHLGLKWRRHKTEGYAVQTQRQSALGSAWPQRRLAPRRLAKKVSFGFKLSSHAGAKPKRGSNSTAFGEPEPEGPLLDIVHMPLQCCNSSRGSVSS